MLFDDLTCSESGDSNWKSACPCMSLKQLINEVSVVLAHYACKWENKLKATNKDVAWTQLALLSKCIVAYILVKSTTDPHTPKLCEWKYWIQFEISRRKNLFSLMICRILNNNFAWLLYFTSYSVSFAQVTHFTK
jgi:hypothetical protein